MIEVSWAKSSFITIFRLLLPGTISQHINSPESWKPQLFCNIFSSHPCLFMTPLLVWRLLFPASTSNFYLKLGDPPPRNRKCGMQYLSQPGQSIKNQVYQFLFYFFFCKEYCHSANFKWMWILGHKLSKTAFTLGCEAMFFLMKGQKQKTKWRILHKGEWALFICSDKYDEVLTAKVLNSTQINLLLYIM